MDAGSDLPDRLVRPGVGGSGCQGCPAGCRRIVSIRSRPAEGNEG
jgi:hypothetical protein